MELYVSLYHFNCVCILRLTYKIFENLTTGIDLMYEFNGAIIAIAFTFTEKLEYPSYEYSFLLN